MIVQLACVTRGTLKTTGCPKQSVISYLLLRGLKSRGIDIQLVSTRSLELGILVATSFRAIDVLKILLRAKRKYLEYKVTQNSLNKFGGKNAN